MYSKPSQNSSIKYFFWFQKLAQISVNCIKFPKEKIKISVAIEMFKIENHCKTSQVVDTTDRTQHKAKTDNPNKTLIRMPSLRTLKRNLKRILKRTLLLRTLKSTIMRTLLLSTLKRILSLSALKMTLSLRTLTRALSLSTLSLTTLKGPNETLTPLCRL